MSEVKMKACDKCGVEYKVPYVYAHQKNCNGVKMPEQTEPVAPKKSGEDTDAIAKSIKNDELRAQYLRSVANEEARKAAGDADILTSPYVNPRKAQVAQYVKDPTREPFYIAEKDFAMHIAQGSRPVIDEVTGDMVHHKGDPLFTADKTLAEKRRQLARLESRSKLAAIKDALASDTGLKDNKNSDMSVSQQKIKLGE